MCVRVQYYKNGLQNRKGKEGKYVDDKTNDHHCGSSSKKEEKFYKHFGFDLLTLRKRFSNYTTKSSPAEHNV